jgi:LPXTG-motif cell wall-anchored protein
VSADKPAPSASATALVLADDAATAPRDAVLASTGSDPVLPALIAGFLVVIGAAATFVARSRRRGADEV